MCSMGKPWADHPADCRKLRLGQDGALQHLSPHIAPVSPTLSLQHYSGLPPHCFSTPLHRSSTSPHCSSISPHCSELQAMLLPSETMQGPAAHPGWWDTGLWGSSPVRKKDLTCRHPVPHRVPISQEELLSIATVLVMLNLLLNKIHSCLNKCMTNKCCRVF